MPETQLFLFNSLSSPKSSCGTFDQAVCRIGGDLVFEKFWSSFLKRNDSSPWTKIMADFDESVSYIKNSSNVLTLIWHSPTSTSIKVLKWAIPNDRIHSLCRHLTRTDLDSLRVLNVYLLKHIEAQHPLRNQCDTTHLRLTIVSCASEHLILESRSEMTRRLWQETFTV